MKPPEQDPLRREAEGWATLACQPGATNLRPAKQEKPDFSGDFANRRLGTVVVIGYPGESTHSFANG